jgi:hypothetical protein
MSRFFIHNGIIIKLCIDLEAQASSFSFSFFIYFFVLFLKLWMKKKKKNFEIICLDDLKKKQN